MIKLNWDDIYDLHRKYMSSPRKGWSKNGSRKKSNETIEVNRAEVLNVLDNALTFEIGFRTNMASNNYYEKLLCAIADGEDDAVECDKCCGVYRLGWGEACPYCEIEHEKVVVVTKQIDD